MIKWRHILLFMGCLLYQGQASAQSQAVRQSGTVTSGHVPTWTANGVIQDGGTSNSGNINTLGITADGGTPFCIEDTKTHTGPYRQFCMGLYSSSNLATISVTPFNGADDMSLNIIINGVSYPFPQIIPPPPVAQTPLRNKASGTADTATINDANGTVAWNSAATSNKTETLPQCQLSVNGFTISIKDEIGTATTYPITISSPSSTIEGLSSYLVFINKQSVTLQCNGYTTNWIAK